MEQHDDKVSYSPVNSGGNNPGFWRLHRNKIIAGIFVALAIGAIVVAVIILTVGTTDNHDDDEGAVNFPALRSAQIRMMSTCDHGISRGNNEFGNRFMLSSEGSSGSIVISPFSVSALMAMTLAATSGETARQIRDTMTFPCSDSTTFKGYEDFTKSIADLESLDTANRIFVDEKYTIKPEFRRTAEERFGAVPESVNFVDNYEGVRNKINSWVEEKTRQKIREFLQPGTVTPTSGAILVNAVYFKGSWKTKFDPEATRPKDFSIYADAVRGGVPMMHLTEEFNVGTVPELESEVIELPYEGDRVSMFLILPTNKDEYFPPSKDLEKRLMGQELGSLFEKYLKPERTSLELPKFKIESTHEVDRILMSLGVVDLFSDEKADFSGMTSNGGGGLSVSGIIQRAFIEVNEEGTEAAAATGFNTRSGFLMQPERTFICNRPFMFILRDKQTKMNLFMGRVNDIEEDSLLQE